MRETTYSAIYSSLGNKGLTYERNATNRQNPRLYRAGRGRLVFSIYALERRGPVMDKWHKMMELLNDLRRVAESLPKENDREYLLDDLHKVRGRLLINKQWQKIPASGIKR